MVPLAAMLLLKVSRVAPVKLIPVITTCVPGVPTTGEKPVMIGPAPVTKLVEVVRVPLVVVTVIGPVVAPVGTFTWICVPFWPV